MFTEHDAIMELNLHHLTDVGAANIESHILKSRLIRGVDNEPSSGYGLIACTVLTEGGSPFVLAYMLHTKGEAAKTLITRESFNDIQKGINGDIEDTDVMALQDTADLNNYVKFVKESLGIVPKVINLNSLVVKSNRGNSKLDLFNQLISGNYVKHRMTINKLNSQAKACHLRLYTNDKEYLTYSIHADVYSGIQIEALRDYLYLTGSLLA